MRTGVAHVSNHERVAHVLRRLSMGAQPDLIGGTANAHFLIGPAVKGGRYGEQASLTKLDATNNVVPTLDFRSLFSTGLTWLGVQDTQTVLGGRYDPVPALA